MVKLIAGSDFDKMTKSGVVIVDFAASWCGPCRMLAPILEELSEEFEGKITFLKLDVDEETALALQYKISSVPSLAVFKDGKYYDKYIGLKSKEELRDILTSLL